MTTAIDAAAQALPRPRTVVLHGALRRKYGARLRLHVDSVAEAVRALSAALPGFAADIRRGRFHILRGPRKDGRDIGIEAAHLGLGDIGEIHIIPALAGAGGKGG